MPATPALSGTKNAYYTLLILTGALNARPPESVLRQKNSDWERTMNSKTWAIAVGIGLLVSLDLKVSAIPLNFDFNGGDITAVGGLSIISAGGGSYTATSGYVDISGGAYPGDYDLVANPAGTGLAISPLGFFAYDDLYFPNQPAAFLDYFGLLFKNPANNFEVKLWGVGDSTYYMMGASPAGFVDWGTDAGFKPNSADPSSIPDGGRTIAMLGMSLLILRWMRGMRTA